MARSIFGKKKKAAAETAPAEQKGPVVTMLSPFEADNADPRRKRRQADMPNAPAMPRFGPTILSDRLGA